MKNSSPKTYLLVIACYLEPEWVEQIRAVSDRVTVVYQPELLPAPRYACDHFGAPLQRSDEEETRWVDLLGQADILFNFDSTHMDALPDLAPRLQWVQATSAGIGQAVKRYRYDERMPHTVFTTASGVHARPLAEFVIMSLLMHYKQARFMMTEQQKKRWERYTGADLEEKTIGVLGLGRVGSEVARVAGLLGMRTCGSDLVDKASAVHQFFPMDRWREMLPLLDVLVLSVPHTPDTEGLVDASALQLLPRGAFFINIARGAVVDEQALIAALQSGHLGGAALDVFASEPLPAGNPLWEMPNVLVSPHSASTSGRENQRIVDLFCDNLRRFLAGEPLRNVLDTQRMY